MTWRVYLRSDEGRPDEMTTTSDPTAAESAYRAMLARGELEGRRVAAVITSTLAREGGGGGRTIYFSRFDEAFGHGRIHPAAPLDLFRRDDGTGEATRWRPAPAASDEPHDWEADPRPLGECLRAWHSSPGWSRDRGAAELRTSRRTYDGWCDGRSTAAEGMIRRLMTLIDLQGRAP